MIGVWKILQEQIWDRHRSVNVSSSSDKKGKIVVITGGNRGIGFEAVRKLLALESHSSTKNLMLNETKQSVSTLKAQKPRSERHLVLKF